MSVIERGYTAVENKIKTGGENRPERNAVQEKMNEKGIVAKSKEKMQEKARAAAQWLKTKFSRNKPAGLEALSSKKLSRDDKHDLRLMRKQNADVVGAVSGQSSQIEQNSEHATKAGVVTVDRERWNKGLENIDKDFRTGKLTSGERETQERKLYQETHSSPSLSPELNKAWQDLEQQHQKGEILSKEFLIKRIALSKAAGLERQRADREGHTFVDVNGADQFISQSKEAAGTPEDRSKPTRKTKDKTISRVWRTDGSRYQASPLTSETLSRSRSNEQSPHTDDLPEIPTDYKELYKFNKINFDPLSQLPPEQFKDVYDQFKLGPTYRKYLEHKIQAEIDRQKPGVTFPDTVTGVVEGNPAFLQRALFCETGRIVDANKLAEVPFSHIAKELGIPLPDNYFQHFR